MQKNFSAGIHVFVRKGRKYLVLRRSDDDITEPKAWDLPGGGIEFGEQPLAAAVRETAEEAGIEIEITTILTVWALPYLGRWSVEVLVEGVWKKGEVAVSREHSEHQWVNREDFLRLRPQSVHVQAAVQVMRRK